MGKTILYKLANLTVSAGSKSVFFKGVEQSKRRANVEKQGH